MFSGRDRSNQGKCEMGGGRGWWPELGLADKVGGGLGLLLLGGGGGLCDERLTGSGLSLSAAAAAAAAARDCVTRKDAACD